VLDLIDEHILNKCEDSESKVFFQKMKGDYYRYRSEYAQEDVLEEVKESAGKAY